MTEGVERELLRLEREAGLATAVLAAGEVTGHAVVLTSAFNPPTVGHTALLSAAALAVGANSQLALLTTRNVDKGLYGASLADRVGMLLALRDELPGLGVAASNQAKIVDQAAALRQRVPRGAFDMVVGFDTLGRVFERRYYRDMEGELAPFFRVHRVIAANRGEVSRAEVESWVRANGGRFGERIVVADMPAEAAQASSTEARAGVGREGQVPVPASVREYIARERLYRG